MRLFILTIFISLTCFFAFAQGATTEPPTPNEIRPNTIQPLASQQDSDEGSSPLPYVDVCDYDPGLPHCRELN